MLPLLAEWAFPIGARAVDLGNPVSLDNLDPETFCAWDPGAEPKEQRLANEPRNAIWTRERRPEWFGIPFAGSKVPGPRHLRVGFKEPVMIGSILARGAVRDDPVLPAEECHLGSGDGAAVGEDPISEDRLTRKEASYNDLFRRG